MQGETLVAAPAVSQPTEAENASEHVIEYGIATIEPYLQDAALEKARKQDEAREKVMEEILQTEGTYLQDLKKLKRLFMEPLTNEPDLLPREEIHMIFSNLPTIVEIHESLYGELRAAFADTDNTPARLSAAFLDACDQMKNYAIYCANRPHSISAQERLRKKFPRLEKFVSDLEKSVGNSLDSYLVKPVQRLCRYPLLFSAILDKTPSEHPDFAELQHTWEQLQQVANDVNEFALKAESANKIYELNQRLSGYDEQLSIPGRLLLFEIPSADVIHPMTGDKREPFYLGIFSDMILFAKQKPKKKLSFKHKIALSNASCREPAIIGIGEWPVVITETIGSTFFEITMFLGSKFERNSVVKALATYIKVEKEKAALMGSVNKTIFTMPRSASNAAFRASSPGGGKTRSRSSSIGSNSSNKEDEPTDGDADSLRSLSQAVIRPPSSSTYTKKRRNSLGDIDEVAPHVKFNLETVNEDFLVRSGEEQNLLIAPPMTKEEQLSAAIPVRRRKSLPPDLVAAGLKVEEIIEGAGNRNNDSVSATDNNGGGGSSKGNVLRRFVQRHSSKARLMSRAIPDELSSIVEAGGEERAKASTIPSRSSSVSSIQQSTATDSGALSDSDILIQRGGGSSSSDFSAQHAEEIRRLRRENRKLKDKLAESQRVVANLVEALRGIERAAVTAVATRTAVM